MYLKTLTVRGFKSFSSATTFAFEPGVTAVVGPNGSGKSNVVDALAWVMGEQGVKSLRGGSMEDVIFAGTAERQPLGRASVSLTIDNSDAALPIDYTEVTISRTMFRSGGSEYTINGSKCRLLDIQELLSDSGLGREMHVIVGQGQLDQILHATPEQRRGFIEEAAGVLKHRRRRERSVRKLESMQTNLDRLEDLIAEISRQLAPLGRQAKVARRAQRIQYEVRDALSRLIADDLVQAATALQASSQGEQHDVDAAAQLKDTLAAQDTQIAELNSQAETLRVRAEKFSAGGHRLAQIQERLRSVASLAAERSRSLEASASVDFSAGRDPQQLRDQADQVDEETEAAQQQVEAATATLEATSTVRAEAEERLKTEESRITEQLRAVADRRAGLATLHGQVETAQGRLEAAQSRQRRAQDQHDAEHAAVEESRAELAEFEQRLADVDTEGPGLEQAYQRAQERHGELRSQYEELTAEQRRLEIAVSEYRARLSGLQAARSPRDGAAALEEQDAGWITGPYADTLRVHRGWETALAAVLGSLDSALVVSDAQAASSAIAWLGDHGGGRAHLVYPQTAQRSDSPSGELPNGAHWALDVVTVSAELAAPLVSALTGVVVVADEAAGEQLVGTTGVTAAVTAEGVILRAGERIGGAAVENAEIAINAQIEELSAKISTAEKDLERVTEQSQRSHTEVNAAELEVNRTLETLQTNETQLSSTTDQLNRLKAEIGRSQQRVTGFAQEIQEAETAAVDAAEQLREITRRLEAAENEELVEEPSTEERDRLTEAASSARREEVDARLAVRAAQEELKQLQERAASLRRSAQAEEHRREQARRTAEARSERAQQADTVRIEADEAIQTITAQLTQTQTAQQTAADRHAGVKTQIAELTETRAAQSKQLEEITSRLHQAELQQTELRLAMEAAENRADEELSLTAAYLIEHYGPDQPVPDVDSDHEGDDAEAASAPYVREEQEARLGRARRDLKALGKVNPLALEEHAALEERHTYLQGQLADLKTSRQDLLDIIAEVDSEVHKVFTAAWEDTRIQFERVFARLFPGGEGRLELTNPEDMLNTGIEVHARPPGKRIRRLSLLSGGERSLTAVALLVAIFKARPSPFYVMDEVEAALDDTNLSRLLVIFDELRENSQLIVITHQKRTMEIADALYGVSMRQDGSTRVVSQRLGS
ncbi:chromosome segregation protein SMC [Garicola koreensis]|uniref:Chromosome partition protein Smc n=1 Tax=Garicola koreensis TaxID=1262554 RepID=A0A7W5XK76_9MICC|nr:chromosome segregation protein SMC [Garicola koreensis]MBB3667232.1 chromosome segregation protein [Garicola koreensis]